MLEPESVNNSEGSEEAGLFRSRMQFAEDRDSKAWGDENFDKYMKLSKISSSPTPELPDPEEEEISHGTDDLDPWPSGNERELSKRSREPSEPEKDRRDDFILTSLPTNKKGIIAVMFLIEFIKKRVGPDNIKSILYHYNKLGWFSEGVLHRLMRYSKMIFGDLGYFECETEDDIPNTSTLHHVKVLEIIFIIKNGEDITKIKEFNTLDTLREFNIFTEKGLDT